VGSRIVSVFQPRGGGFPRVFGWRVWPGRSDARPHRSGVAGAVPSVAGSGARGRAVRSPPSRRGDRWSVGGRQSRVSASAAHPISRCRRDRLR